MKIKIKINSHLSPINQLIDSISKREAQIVFASHTDALQAQNWLNSYELIAMLKRENIYRKNDKIYQFILSFFSISKICFTAFEIKFEYDNQIDKPSVIINGSSTESISSFERAVYFMSPCIAIMEFESSPVNYYNHLVHWKNKNKFHGDYFRYNCEYKCTSKGRIINNGRMTLSILEFGFRTNFKDEQLFRREVASITASIVMNCKTDYEKIKSIYQYIVNHVVYDNSFSYYSAYDALIRGCAVCEGISLLLHAMLRQANINARMACGTGRSEPHSWNVVCLNGNWYNLDATWDLGRRSFMWHYFLCGSSHFPNHSISAELSEEYKKDHILISSQDFERRSVL